jgi:outer membrane receptor protein involved in Fe transport
MLLDEFLSSHAITTVYDLDPGTGNPTGPAFPVAQNNPEHAIFAGVYLQDEWKLVPQLTLNFGARFDEYYASFDKENQPSPRVNLIWQPADATTLHAGYARYFTPPPLENVPVGNVRTFNGTSNQDPNDSPVTGVKAERANYFDAGISQKLAPGLQVGLDGYYKNSVNQLDDGLFGQSLILQAFNYAEGRIWGTEFTGTYTLGGFSTFANLAYSVAQGMNWNSAQFLFSADDLAYTKNHWIYLDHDQRVTGSFGAAYSWKERCGVTRAFVNALYGSGLRQNGGGFEPNSPGTPIPNGASVPSYYSVSLGAEQAFRLSGRQVLKARLDVVNVTDNIYQLRSGNGVGVNAAQFGMRLGVFGTLGYAF